MLVEMVRQAKDWSDRAAAANSYTSLTALLPGARALSTESPDEVRRETEGALYVGGGIGEPGVTSSVEVVPRQNSDLLLNQLDDIGPDSPLRFRVRLVSCYAC
jgi:hypothetical protein